mmetsp:Transcript_12679/g.21492  ORF Transcript_12679/g.21492 Transcript_12679/m.21492 type:complete len:92 (-) Transcript_12679:16-291(-)|eukprot:CAMPEP_0198136444 /NCGR_PEP_ID=MMETSP1443-20131203/88_1 /TAXON_ID=186043 /ORGANISM="Entomoneis sp., Strain CCMP2396" /LENGTH=91 /DNA_ID=CAMNT_0043797665 /DNA_START=196 /DNA_END=471 /DNA_ORIENTATION=-
MKSTVAILLISLIMALSASAFAPAFVKKSVASTELNMGLFDAFMPKKPASTSPQEEGDFLDGKGKKVTIRADEDNAMWIEEDDSGKRKSGK